MGWHHAQEQHTFPLLIVPRINQEFAAVFKLDYKRAIYAAIVFMKASPTFLTVLRLLGVIVYLLALLLWACSPSHSDARFVTINHCTPRFWA